MTRRYRQLGGRALARLRRLAQSAAGHDIVDEPAVTIVVPVFGTEEYLGACLTSILGQAFRSFEVIVVDDCSPGDVAGIVATVSRGDPRVRLVRHDVNRGLIRARLTGASAARGRYLSFVDSDDDVEEFFIAAMHQAAIEHDADLVQCELWQIEPDGRALPLSRAGGGLVLHGDDIVRGYLGGKMWNSLCTKLVRTTVWAAATSDLDVEQESIYFGEDILITFLLASNSAVFVAVPDRGYRWIKRSTSVTKSVGSERLVRCITDLDAVYRALRELLAERREPPELVNAFFEREFANVVVALLRQATASERNRSGGSPRSPAALGLLGAIVLELGS